MRPVERHGRDEMDRKWLTGTGRGGERVAGLEKGWLGWREGGRGGERVVGVRGQWRLVEEENETIFMGTDGRNHVDNSFMAIFIG